MSSQITLNNLQKFETWNTLVPIYTKWKDDVAKENNTFFVSYYKNKIEEAMNARQNAYDKLPMKIKSTLILN